MSGTKVMGLKGVHQEDLVELVYYLKDARASDLALMGSVVDKLSGLVTLLGALTSVSMSISGIGSQASFSTAFVKCTSISDLTAVTVTLV
jgi:hypothetical protein